MNDNNIFTTQLNASPSEEEQKRLKLAYEFSCLHRQLTSLEAIFSHEANQIYSKCTKASEARLNREKMADLTEKLKEWADKADAYFQEQNKWD